MKKMKISNRILKTELIECTKCGKIGERDQFSDSWNGCKGWCKQCKAKADKLYAQRHRKQRAEYYRNLWEQSPRRKIVNQMSKNARRFGIDASEFVEGKACVRCGMTNEEHISRYGHRLMIHHKDGNGRKAMRLQIPVNNDLTNFDPICRSCHCAIENQKNNYAGRGAKIWETRRRNLLLRELSKPNP